MPTSHEAFAALSDGKDPTRVERRQIDRRMLAQLMNSLGVSIPEGPMLAYAVDPNSGARVRQFVDREFVLRQRLDRLLSWYDGLNSESGPKPDAATLNRQLSDLAATANAAAQGLGIGLKGELPKKDSTSSEHIIAAAGSLEQFLASSYGLLHLADWALSASEGVDYPSGFKRSEWSRRVFVRTVVEIWVEVLAQPIASASIREAWASNPLVRFIGALFGHLDQPIPSSEIAAIILNVV